MKLLDAGEVLPSGMILSLVTTKLASRECQKKGWVLEGIGTAGGVDELEEAIVMATEVCLFWPLVTSTQDPTLSSPVIPRRAMSSMLYRNDRTAMIFS